MKKQVVPPFDREHATHAVVAVGPNGGRGFLMDIPVGSAGATSRIVITAAHCLPRLPPACTCAFVHEKTYPILGPLGTKPSVMAECLFVDPVADLAVLGEPDIQAVGEAPGREWDALMGHTGSLSLDARESDQPTAGWLLSLDGQWAPCTVTALGNGGLWVTEALGGIRGGMSGSPILLESGRVIGVICTSAGVGKSVHTEGGPNPQLTRCLPHWIVQAFTLPTKRRAR